MRLELLSLMQTHDVCHPSKIESFVLHDDYRATIRIRGFAWWLDGKHNPANAKLRIELHGISEGNLDFRELGGNFEEDLEDFWVKRIGDIPWAAYPRCTVYGNAALQDPISIYVALDKYLVDVGAPYRAEHFVHAEGVGSLSDYLRRTGTKSFFLCQGAKAVCDLAVESAAQQHCPTTMIAHEINKNELLWVNIGRTYAICKSAYAFTDEDEREG